MANRLYIAGSTILLIASVQRLDWMLGTASILFLLGSLYAGDDP